MSDIGSTNIDNLPTIQEENLSNNSENQVINNPIQQKVEERNQQNLNQQNASQQNSIQQNSIQQNANNEQELNNQILQAGLGGATTLPSRDIPINTLNITNDEQIKTDFIPNKNTNDYITEHLSTEDIVKQNINKSEEDIFLDKLYSEISLPILISLVYFIFKLPVVDNIYKQLFPFCFTKTGNMKITGYLLSSVNFGLFIYLINKIIKTLSF
jgi:hypothetical protein